MTPTLMIVDGNYLLHRVMRLDNFAALETTDGMVTGGVYGVLTLLRNYLIQYSSVSRCVFVWDGGHSQRRVMIHPEYKMNRPKNDPEQAQTEEAYMRMWCSQRQILEEILRDFGIISLRVPEREGDDVIGLIVYQYPETAKVVVTDDQDLLQLVAPGCVVFRPLAKEEISLENFEKAVGVPPSFYLLLKAINGDESDNIPGIDGVGGKTAQKIVQEVASCFPPKVVAPGTMSCMGTYSEDAWCDLLQKHLPEACTALVAKDTRGGRRYRAVAANIERVATNLALMDISLEHFSAYERAVVTQVLGTECYPFNFMKVQTRIQKLQFGSALKSLSAWVAPFERLC